VGMSVKDKTLSETKVRDLEDHIVLWPLKDLD